MPLVPTELYDVLRELGVKEDRARAAAASTTGYNRFDEQFARIDQRFDAIDKRFADIANLFEKVDVRFTALEARIATLETRTAIHNWMLGTNIVLTIAILIKLLVQ